MTTNPLDYLHDTQRVQEKHKADGLNEWVEESYTDMEKSMRVGASYAMVSKDGQWIEARIPLPISSYQAEERKLALELVRRKFVMDGWVRAVLEIKQDAPNPWLTVAAPREALVVEVDGIGEIMPEIGDGETLDAAVQRFLNSGAVYYANVWEQVTIPPHQIAQIVRRYPGAPSKVPSSADPGPL